MTFTVWDTVQKFNTTLTGSNLIATGVSLNGCVRAADPQTSGKYYFEYTTNTIGVSQSGVGVCGGHVNLPTAVNSLLAVAEVNKPGNAFVNNVNVGVSIGAISNGSLVCVAVDVTNRLIWWRVGAAGSWNATSGSANNPATGVGGVSLAAIMPAYQSSLYPYAAVTGTGEQITGNFGASAFTGTVPSGFTSGWPTGTTPTINLVTTQTGAEAWVTQSHGTFRVTQAGLNTWVTATHAPFRVTQAGTVVWIDVSQIAAFPIGVKATSGVGSLAVTTLNSLVVSGIATSEALGTPILNPGTATLSPAGIASGEAVGSPIFHASVTLPVTGIATSEALGTPHLVQVLSVSGIATSEALGTPILTALSSSGLMIFRGFP